MRERARKRELRLEAAVLYNLMLEIMYHHFCCTVLVTQTNCGEVGDGNYTEIWITGGQNHGSIAIMKSRQANVGSSLIKSQCLRITLQVPLCPLDSWLHILNLPFFLMKSNKYFQLSSFPSLLPASRIWEPKGLFSFCSFILALLVQASDVPAFIVPFKTLYIFFESYFSPLH